MSHSFNYFMVDICGCPLQGCVAFALSDYFVYGIFAVIFVFTNVCYPPFYYVDYMFGISGATLIIFSCVAAYVLTLRKYQIIRIITGTVIVLNVLLTAVSTYLYTIVRWNDVIVTGIVSVTRSPSTKDFPDILWNVLVIISCMNSALMVFTVVYVSLLFCSKQHSSLFTQPYQNYMRPLLLTTGTINVPVATTPYQPNK